MGVGRRGRTAAVVTEEWVEARRAYEQLLRRFPDAPLSAEARVQLDAAGARALRNHVDGRRRIGQQQPVARVPPGGEHAALSAHEGDATRVWNVSSGRQELEDEREYFEFVMEQARRYKAEGMPPERAMDEMLGYEVEDHIIDIRYYRPRGDDKEAWDNIDIRGFLGHSMQIKVNFLCKDSILAAPLAIEVARCLDLAATRGESGIIEELGAFFKMPMSRSSRPEHAFHKQQATLLTWLEG